jgi:hypothetical protein
MIQKNESGCYELICDECGETVDEEFDTFDAVLQYKRATAKAEGWRSVKDYEDGWHDLCPSCATPEIIAKLLGGGT